jgi:alpha-methylacyl-CoA racemase
MKPLSSIRVVEFAGLGPGPFAAMMLADMGAEVIRIDRAGAGAGFGFLERDREIRALDLKSPAGIAAALELLASADVLIEGYRPGVMERLGLGPEAVFAVAPRLVYGRMTGWGQSGPLAQEPGHDLNYLAVSGLLSTMGEPDRPPPPPLNLVGDYGGGGMYLAFGIVTALHEVARSGRGVVVDAAMVDGIGSLATLIHGLRGNGGWVDARGANMLDGGAPFYRCYATADGRHVSIAAIEPQFFANLVAALGLPRDLLARQWERAGWPALAAELEAIFAGATLATWCERLTGKEICFAPVLTMAEAIDHPHARARDMFRPMRGLTLPAPAPRFEPAPS